jgi:hypothetical protein
MTAQLFAMTPRMALDLARARQMPAQDLIAENVRLKRELRDLGEALATVSEAYSRIRGAEQ